MKAGIDLYSLYFMKKAKRRREEVKENPVMFPATYYGYPTNVVYPVNSGYELYTHSPRGRDVDNIGGGGSSSEKVDF